MQSIGSLYFRGETDEPPLPTDALVEPELAAVAANISLRQSGVWVSLTGLDEMCAGFDGERFSRVYRAEVLVQDTSA